MEAYGLYFKRCSRSAITFIEIMMAFLVLFAVLLPIFWFLTGTVKDTERFYTEIVAMSRAKFIMDSIMFQLPWRVLRENRPGEDFCRFEDPESDVYPDIGNFMDTAIPKMFGTVTKISNVLMGDGIYTCGKGFNYRARVKVVDLDDPSAGSIKFSVSDSNNEPFEIRKLAPKDADGKYNLIKKIVVQIKWSNSKGSDPNTDKYAKTLFLVAFKSNLEG